METPLLMPQASTAGLLKASEQECCTRPPGLLHMAACKAFSEMFGVIGLPAAYPSYLGSRGDTEWSMHTGKCVCEALVKLAA